ncbi:hypothetical protein EVAR_89730_1 [Eumeta japonica]|uniref:Uncharacterized protein n=1 Tax=Eumeta variegata TaxID=151549 RepID=A0A4C1Y7J8_EUMVA|nr:hypothetical protein EVAR_89730_1 [Eumeta japonica]
MERSRIWRLERLLRSPYGRAWPGQSGRTHCQWLSCGQFGCSTKTGRLDRRDSIRLQNTDGSAGNKAAGTPPPAARPPRAAPGGRVGGSRVRRTRKDRSQEWKEFVLHVGGQRQEMQRQRSMSTCAALHDAIPNDDPRNSEPYSYNNMFNK